ncbi:hypothetical protein JN535_04035 [Cellulosimicrobium cellulans]|uniref:hypothetical protein n=1 Tax=Cellulosimicrobium cellulans TaxID=1710 RepID=UPI00196467DD|nr:hypothetical protein [Cellulosimicrobium cellulans]MBN0039343.1 hypothetical protein [Cellulosimicrobium cellulans]
MGDTAVPQPVAGVQVGTTADAGALMRLSGHALWKLVRSPGLLNVTFVMIGFAIVFMLGLLGLSAGWLTLLLFLPVLAVIFTVAAVIFVVVLLAYSLHVLSDKRSVVFLGEDGTATVRVRLRRGAWHVQDHMAAPVGQGHGKRLREALVGPLLAQADATGTRVTFDAVDATANQYDVVPLGFVAGGRSWQGRRYTSEPVAQRV